MEVAVELIKGNRNRKKRKEKPQQIYERFNCRMEHRQCLSKQEKKWIALKRKAYPFAGCYRIRFSEYTQRVGERKKKREKTKTEQIVFVDTSEFSSKGHQRQSERHRFIYFSFSFAPFCGKSNAFKPVILLYLA